MTAPLEAWLEPEGLDQIEEWAASGFTNAEIARNIGVNTTRFTYFRKGHDQVAHALERGRCTRGDGERRCPVPREWTAAETRHVSRMAGLVPLGQLAADLGRDPLDVADECDRIGADPRYAGTPLYWCPFCSQWRHEIKARGVFAGMCPTCARRKQIETIEGRIADLWPLLTPEQRDKYAETEAELWSMRDPPPKRPSLAGLDERAEIAARTAYDAEFSRWEARQECRRYKAVQKRKERIEAKVRENERT